MRLRYTRGALIFAPGESFELELLPNLIPLKSRERIRFEARLLPVYSDESVWSQRDDLDLRPPSDADNETGQTIPYRIPMPKEEGVYNLVVEAAHPGLRSRLGWKQQVTQRVLQLVVLRPVIDPPPLRREGDWKTEVEIDPANPSWWKRFTAIRIPGLKSGPLGSGAAEAWRHPLGRMTRLSSDPGGGNIAWQAYQLPVHSPGRPYLLEVEYPDDAPRRSA